MNGEGRSDGSSFSRDDLFLLLEAYRNQVETNQTLMEQQSRLIEQHIQILGRQAEVCNDVSEVINKIGRLSEREAEKHADLQDKINTSQLGCVKDHSSIKTKMTILYIGIGAIVIALISLAHSAYEKLDVIKSIAEKLGV